MKYIHSTLTILILFASSLVVKGQDSLSIVNTPSKTTTVDTSSKKQKQTPNSTEQYKVGVKKIENPSVGLGIGTFAFYGDVERNKSPLVSRFAYEVYVTQRMNASILLNFNFVMGKLSGNERFVNGVRNTNFESTIRAASMNFIYDFGRKLPLKRTATPFLLIGIESFEFLSKTDLYDQNNNKYYYWSDGTIRNIDEKASNANDAVLLKRDYTYESNVRESGVDSLGKYGEHSFAIPIGLGFQFKINEFINFRIVSTMHFTFTDYIDGIVQLKGNGKPKGFTESDFFMMNSFGLSYNFRYKKKQISPVIEDIESNNNIDFYAIDRDDKDGDGVIDFIDKCQGTPPGVAVDTAGCPFDDDNDGIPNYRDDEINSVPNAIVNTKGVEITDEMAGETYDNYRNAITYVDTLTQKPIYISRSQEVEYTIDLGTYTQGLPASELTKFLSIHDIESIHLSDLASQYIAGSFNNLNDAKKRKAQLIAIGLPEAKIIIRTGDTTFEELSSNSEIADAQINGTKAKSNTKTPKLPTAETGELAPLPEGDKAVVLPTTKIPNPTSNLTIPSQQDRSYNSQRKAKPFISEPGIIFRVQLGAYSRSLKQPIFLGVDDLIEIRTDDGLYKYATGSYTSFEEVAKRKMAMIVAGYDDAFITAYKNGKRITIQEVGATILEGKTITEIPDAQKVSAISKKSVSFKIQVGLYKNEPPAEKQTLYSQIGDVKLEIALTGLNRYVIGSYSTYEEAEKNRAKLASKYNLDDIFIVALFNEEYISVQEALEILK